MKDYYDVWMLTSTLDLDSERLRRAIVATFERRNTAIPLALPDGLSESFAEDSGKLRQWDAFARNLSGPTPEFRALVAQLRDRFGALRL
jgi:hypothetical protein